MAEIERLSSDQLACLEALLRKREAPIVPRLQPPATPEALAAVEGHLGRPLPLEVRQWWGWHDGTDIAPDELAVQGTIGPSFLFLRTERAIDLTRECRADAEDIAPEDPDALWKKNWLAIATLDRMACDCAVEADAPVPILKVDPHLVDEVGAVAARSFGEMVRWWIEALEAGAWVFDTERGRWERRSELISLERDLTRLV
jgi:cell wall assembly regulator SMI1